MSAALLLQVQVAVTANVTVPLLFTGVEWKRAASKALQQTASDAAGGYTQAFVQVEPVEPDYGASTADFLNQELQYSGDGVSWSVRFSEVCCCAAAASCSSNPLS